MRATVLLLPIVACALLSPGSHAASLGCDSIQMISTASPAEEPGFEGLYKYTLSGSWNEGAPGLSRLEISLPLGECDCACDPRVLEFGTPAGSVVGEDQNSHSCQVVYSGTFLCKRARSTWPEMQVPTVQFDVTIPSSCRVSAVGSGTWIFYSPFPPAPDATYADLVVLKSAGLVCSASVTGAMPVCRCFTPVQPSTWGRMKALYH